MSDEVTKNKQPQNPLWLFENDRIQPWAYCDSFFNKEDCEKVIKYGEGLGLMEAWVSSHATDKKRDSQISWIFPNADTEWMFQRLTEAIQGMNSQFFNFHLYGIVEGLQFTRYDAPSGYYGIHMDRGMNLPARKLSVTVQLSDNADYEGGDLVLHHGGDPSTPPMQQGKMLLFPSYVLHEVKPVTKGTRYSLVCWVTGKPFK